MREVYILYHSWDVSGCTESTSESVGLENDLETLYNNGYTVVPVYWIAQWVIGDRDGSTLPNKIVGITFDDGNNLDWYGDFRFGCLVKSFYTVLSEFKDAHPSLPWYSPHAASFVIGSPVARGIIAGSDMTDDWWYDAQNSGLMEIYNHSADHDHTSITSQVYEPDTHFSLPSHGRVGTYLAVRGYHLDGDWTGQGTFLDTTSYFISDAEVRGSANYIANEIGVWPDLFAYPYGGYTPYLVNDYFPSFPGEHNTYAAFSTNPNYVTRSSNRYTLGRFVRGRDWTSSSGLIQILTGSGQ